MCYYIKIDNEFKIESHRLSGTIFCQIRNKRLRSIVSNLWIAYSGPKISIVKLSGIKTLDHVA